jgi:hypothetical protein
MLVLYYSIYRETEKLLGLLQSKYLKQLEEKATSEKTHPSSLAFKLSIALDFTVMEGKAYA